MYRFPADKEKRRQWLEALNLSEVEVGEHARICSRHFLHGDPSNVPSLDIGKRFASPKKITTERGVRALKRATRSPSLSLTSSIAKRSRTRTSTPPSSRASSITAPESTTDEEPMSVSIGEPLLSDFSVHELPVENDDKQCDTDTALAARVEMLKAETEYLRSIIGKNESPLHSRIEQ